MNNFEYQNYFNLIKKVKIVVLVSVGRSGSDFFQSLLDNHSQILKFAGSIFFHNFWEKAICKSDIEDLTYEFIWHSETFLAIGFFKSKYNKLERWDKLGEEKNESFEVDIQEFSLHVKNLMENREINSKNFFIAIHIAYGLASGKNIDDIKILFYHIHHIEKLLQFNLDFSDYDILSSIREPKNTIVSGLNNHKLYNSDSYSSSHVDFLYSRILKESENTFQYPQNSYVLKLEDIHLHSRDFLQNFCNNYNLNWEDSLLESTYHGLKWWGDAVSGKYLDGFNSKIEKKKYIGVLPKHEIYILDYLLFRRMKSYRYEVSNKLGSVLNFPLVLLLIIVPLKYEVDVLIFRVKTDKGIGKKLYNIARSIFHYVRRVKSFYIYLFKRVLNRDFIGHNFFKKNKKVIL